MSLHHLQNNQLRISVNSFGAELCSVKNNAGTEFIWQAAQNIWPRHAPVLFPVVGKLNNDQYTWDNSSYKLSQHGFARDQEFILVEESSNALEFELVPNEETFAKYPFHFSLRIRYELNESSIKTTYIVLNPNNSKMPFSIGAHPGFNCKPLGDFQLEFSNKRPLIAQKLRSGLISDETYTIETNNGILDLHKELFDNDALVFKNTQVEEIALVSKDRKFKVIMECKNWPFFGIWSKKDSDAFVCLEPWYGIADKPAFNGSIAEKEGIITLEPHRSFKAEFILTLF